MHHAQKALIQRGFKRMPTTSQVPTAPIPRTIAKAGSIKTQIRASTTPRAIHTRNCLRFIGSLSPIFIAITCTERCLDVVLGRYSAYVISNLLTVCLLSKCPKSLLKVYGSFSLRSVAMTGYYGVSVQRLISY